MPVRRSHLVALCAALVASAIAVPATAQVEPLESTPDLVIEAAAVDYIEELDLLVFEQTVEGSAGGTLPDARGQLHGAPVLGYLFLTTLRPGDIGFGGSEGLVALAVTSHPDFDDTPIWDEDLDRDYANDGRIFHTHWVLLGRDERVPGGLAVVEFAADDEAVVLPPTNPGMSMYLDSPGFPVVTAAASLRVLVPAERVSDNTDFRFDAVTVYMEVNTDDEARPLLGVYAVYSVLSGDLSLPYRVTIEAIGR